jgi:ribokinase
MVKIAVLASFNMDLVMRAARRPDAGETLQGEFAMYLGGKGFNQAVAARRLGAEVAVAGRVGDDEFGRMFLAALDGEGIDRRAVVVDPADGTGVASIIVEPDGTNTIIQSPRANLTTLADDVAAAVATIRAVDCAVMQRETGQAGTLAFARGVQARTKLLNPAPAGHVSPELIAACDIIVANEIEAAAISGINVHADRDERAAATKIVHEHGTKVVVITLGHRGSVALSDGDVFESPPFAVPVVDTTGAGDAFCAAFAVRRAEGAELADALRFANAAGALACTKHGAMPSMPHRDAVEELMSKGVTA